MNTRVAVFALKAPPAGAAVALLFILLVCSSALLAAWIAPQDTRALGSLSLADSLLPPVWVEGGEGRFILGSDDQGRDLVSALLFGLRLSLLVGIAALALAAIVGVGLGLVAGFTGGAVDAFLMRMAEVQATFPAMLVALLLSGLARGIFPNAGTDVAILILIVSIAAATWVQFARTVRASTLVERGKDYVLAARIFGVPSWRIVVTHILPNVAGPVIVIATISLGNAILTEATLSFLGVGAPPNNPSLGTLINKGNEFLLSGEWWMVLFPALTLSLLVLSVNLVGDWLRDLLDPKLR